MTVLESILQYLWESLRVRSCIILYYSKNALAEVRVDHITIDKLILNSLIQVLTSKIYPNLRRAYDKDC